MVTRHAAVAKGIGRGVARPDSELLLLANEIKPRRSLQHQERLDAAAAGRLADRRPDDGAGAAHAVGNEDLVAIEHPLVPVEPGRGLDRLGVGTGPGFGDRHGEHQLPPPRLLVLCAGGVERRVAERRWRLTQRHTGVRLALQLDQHLHNKRCRIVARLAANPLKNGRKRLGLGKDLRQSLVFMFVVITGVFLAGLCLSSDTFEDILVIIGQCEIDHVPLRHAAASALWMVSARALRSHISRGRSRI